MDKNWRKVTTAEPCQICGKPDWCVKSADGAVALCARIEEGSFQKANGIGGWLHRLIEKPKASHNGNGYANRPKPKPKAKTQARRNWADDAKRLREAMTEECLAALAEATGIPAEAWKQLSPGWANADELELLRAGGAGWAENRPDGAFVFVEHAGDGRIVGLSLRTLDGRKGAPAGCKRGLIVPSKLHQSPDPVLFVEGASDVAACCAMGLTAVGRPSNRSGAEDAAVMLDGRVALVVGECDGKPDGAWPGRDGAKAVAQQLAAKWHEVIRWTLPPLDVKDVREWLRGKVAGGLNVGDVAAMHAAGAELLAVLEGAAKVAKPEKRTQADALVDLAKATYRLGKSAGNETFAVSLDGPAVAVMFRGSGLALRAALSKAYRQKTGKTPSASALADALTALEGMAQDEPAEPLELRVAAHDDGIVLDLGDDTGRAVVVKSGGWAVEAVSPVLFRRTALTAALLEPVPAEPVELLELRKLLNVDNETWPLAVGWLVASLLPGIPHPVLMLGGEQGTGKSTAARLMVGLVDPSLALLRSEPRDPEQWAVAAAGSWVVCLDNISHVSVWLSDALCKAVTGDGWVKRKLYTDGDLCVLTFRRCVMLTSIDPGAMRGDLAERLLLADLQRIPDDQRRTEAELDAAYRAALPKLLGALLSATGRTLAALPGVKLATMPRMADFARVLAALDFACPELTGGRALKLFSDQRRRIADEVVESDPIALAVVKLMEERDTWQGIASELLTAITPNPVPKAWPANGRALSGRLRRLRPALLQIGICYDAPPKKDKTRTHRIEKVANRPPEPPLSPEGGESEPKCGLSEAPELGGSIQPDATSPADRPSENGVFTSAEALSGGSGDMGGAIPAPSKNGRERGEL